MRKTLDATICIRCDIDLRQAINKIADADDESTGEAARKLIKIGLKQYQRNKKRRVSEKKVGRGGVHPRTPSDQA
jgi:hypothetical protein